MEADQGEGTTGEMLEESGPRLGEDVLDNHHLGALPHLEDGGRGSGSREHNPLLRLRKKTLVTSLTELRP